MKSKALSFSAAIKSFVGFLQGTQKAQHTIHSYLQDMHSFEKFLQLSFKRPIELHELCLQTVSHYRDYLQEKGLKPNTRRRKILTILRFFQFLSKRKQIHTTFPLQFPVPHKVERIPLIVPIQDLLLQIEALPEDLLIHHRNKLLLWTLAETGCLVSELCGLRFEHWILDDSQKEVWVFFETKVHHKTPVSEKLYQSMVRLKAKLSSESIYLFSGFNKFGSLGGKMTQRGVEIVVQHYRNHFNLSDLTPRTFRHSVAFMWLQQGCTESEVQNRLGLKTTYCFRSYVPLLNET